MKLFLFPIVLLVLTLIINPVYATVETYNVELNCHVDSFDFANTYVEFDQIQMCEVFGNILVIDPVPAGNTVDVTLDENEQELPLDEPVIEYPTIPLKSLKEQMDNFIKEKQEQLKEKFKLKFGDKWKERWDKAKGKLKDQLDSLLRELSIK
jgi:hypothetical protein